MMNYPYKFNSYDKRFSIEKVTAELTNHGIALIEKIPNSKEFLTICASLGNIFLHPDSEVNGLTQITNTGIQRPEAPGLTNKSLYPHTDRASSNIVPSYTSLFCVKEAEEGGVTLLVDAREIYTEMKIHNFEDLMLLEKHDTVLFGTTGNLYSGSIFSTTEYGKKYIRFRCDDVAYFSSQILSSLEKFRAAVKKFEYRVLLKKGQAYVIQNGRWLHGRTAYKGERLMYRALFDLKTGSNSFGFEP
jgi:alpha-ketoglutarate-dependent taurine dioxygenase